MSHLTPTSDSISGFKEELMTIVLAGSSYSSPTPDKQYISTILIIAKNLVAVSGWTIKGC